VVARGVELIVGHLSPDEKAGEGGVGIQKALDVVIDLGDRIDGILHGGASSLY